MMRQPLLFGRRGWPAITIVVTIGLVGVQLAARAAWQEPNVIGLYPTVLPVTFDLPLNTGSGTQTKIGPLTIGGSVQVTPAVGLGLAVTGKICWNNDCRDNWGQLGGGNFVHRHPFVGNPAPPDSGRSELLGPDVSLSAATVLARAGKSPDGTPTVGVAGYASSSTAFESVGVEGTATADNATNYAVLGYADFFTAYGGYFSGDVGIAAPGDLVLGGTSAAETTARGNSLSEICLNGDCRSAWPTGGGTLWTLTGTVLTPQTSTANVAVGGTGSTAPFRMTQRPSGRGLVSIASDATTRSLIVGTPTPALVTFACGDGQCNGSETAVSCPLDCDTTPPPNVTGLPKTWLINQITNQLYISWAGPTGGDLAGTRIVWGTTASLSPLSTTPFADIPAPTRSYWTPPLAHSTTYFFGLYSYDAARNYASGTFFNITMP